MGDKDRQFEQLFSRCFPKVRQFAACLLKSEDEAEDIAQEVFVTLWKNEELWLDKDGNLDGYLYTMTKNRVLDRIKHLKVVENYGKEISAMLEDSELQEITGPLENLYKEEIRLLTMLYVERLPEVRKKVFEASRIEGMTNKEIAEKMHISVRTVEHHIYLSLKGLKELLKIAVFLIFL